MVFGCVWVSCCGRISPGHDCGSSGLEPSRWDSSINDAEQAVREQTEQLVRACSREQRDPATLNRPLLTGTPAQRPTDRAGSSSARY